MDGLALDQRLALIDIASELLVGEEQRQPSVLDLFLQKAVAHEGLVEFERLDVVHSHDRRHRFWHDAAEKCGGNVEDGLLVVGEGFQPVFEQIKEFIAFDVFVFLEVVDYLKEIERVAAAFTVDRIHKLRARFFKAAGGDRLHFAAFEVPQFNDVDILQYAFIEGFYIFSKPAFVTAEDKKHTAAIFINRNALDEVKATSVTETNVVDHDHKLAARREVAEQLGKEVFQLKEREGCLIDARRLPLRAAVEHEGEKVEQDAAVTLGKGRRADLQRFKHFSCQQRKDAVFYLCLRLIAYQRDDRRSGDIVVS